MDEKMFDVLLSEIRELRTEFHSFKEEVIIERGERKGRNTIIAVIVSAVISVFIAFVNKIFK